MNNLLNNAMISAILHRHSMRVYKQDTIPGDVLNAVLACGLSAPSGMNRQPWHISVLNDQSLMDEMNQVILAEACKDPVYASMLKDGYHVFHHAPALLVISAKADDIWSEIDCGLLAGNMFLAANSLGLGACVIGFMRFLFTSSQADHYLKCLRVPEGHQALFGFILGYPEDSGQAKLPYQLSMTDDQKGKITYL